MSLIRQDPSRCGQWIISSPQKELSRIRIIGTQTKARPVGLSKSDPMYVFLRRLRLLRFATKKTLCLASITDRGFVNGSILIYTFKVSC